MYNKFKQLGQETVIYGIGVTTSGFLVFLLLPIYTRLFSPSEYGVIDVIAALCAMRDGKIPAAKNCDKKADGCNLNIANQEQEKNIRFSLCCSYTYGGQTAAVILKKVE